MHFHKYFDTISLFENGAFKNLNITSADVSHSIFAPFFLFYAIFLARNGVTVSTSSARML
jgi:hypothetical protein